MKARSVRITEAEGPKGLFVVHVPLSRFGKDEAVLELSAYNELVALKLYPNWSILGGGVYARGPNGLRLLVARVLTDAKAGEVVEYRDGNPLNLCLENLAVRDGFSTKHDRALLVEARDRLEAEKAESIKAGSYHPRFRKPLIFRPDSVVKSRRRGRVVYSQPQGAVPR
ncbi:hypothetical protein FJ930_12615 [Mesorhizobium sp. B2-4-15]|uniref:hypothetical protein n=1 Tax=Mesorhizobium sp. B2-4-15 TaxID=2589934 RepID=UPI001153E937|nr:hypothetical protein [Mesorhizobium sp. B2-4-15]TPK72573.1 hypothetical protein FJ930_12615 [Mesorhizobium sp. B2-4-15]